MIAPKPAAPQDEGKRLAAAFAAKAAKKSTSVTAATGPSEPAPSREECPRCGIPGWKGCAHWLPCEDQPRKVELPDEHDAAKAQQFVPGSVRGKPQTFTGKRRGIGASRL